MTLDPRSAAATALLFLCLLTAASPAARAQTNAAAPVPAQDPASVAFCDGCHGADKLAQDATVPDLGGQVA